MDKLAQTAMNFFNTISPYVWILGFVALIVNGVLMAVGGQEGREKSKKAFPFVIIGIVIVLLSVELGKLFANQVSF